MNKFEDFRKKSPVFLYRGYEIKESETEINISYSFSLPDTMDFSPSWTFPKPADFSAENDLIFERLVFSLGLAESISYWKAACSPVLHIECGNINSEQKKWWQKLFYLGLGEFRYLNKIETDPESFVNFECAGDFLCKNIPDRKEPEGCLIPIGGGKDSALTLETLKNSGMYTKCYSISGRKSITATVETAGLSPDYLITAGRKFDRSLLKLNELGYMNGHTPFSAIVAFSAEIIAYMNGLKYIVLSNENSANESTVAGQDINHQYSKSFEFENDYNEYEKKYLGTGCHYFSFLRPLAEFQIAKMFISHRKYLPIFRSCNLGSKVSPDIWCGNCPKCLFVALILSPFLERSELNEIFGRDMLEDEKMENYFIELIGCSEHKPFECVGSIDEVNLAVSLAIRKILENGGELPFLYKKYTEMGMYKPESIDEKNKACCHSYNSVNLLPEQFRTILKKEMERLL